MTVVGVDVGSVAAKAMVLADGKVAGRGMAPTGADPALAAETACAKALEAAGADRASVSRVVTTGYGRRATRLSGDVVTEISAAARGASLELLQPPLRFRHGGRFRPFLDDALEELPRRALILHCRAGLAG